MTIPGRFEKLCLHIKRHGLGRNGHIRHRHERVRATVRSTVRARRRVEGRVPRQPGERIARVAPAVPRLELLQAVGFHELDHGVRLVRVGGHAVVDVPDYEPCAGQ